MKAIVGLGNPGEKYQNTRHNIGFMVADTLRAHFSFEPERTKFDGLLSTGFIDGTKTIIFKPQTYMNLSGTALGAMARYFSLEPSDCFVFYDELDLPLGKARVRVGGGAGGHNGIRSCMTHLGADFCRVRLGIGHPGNKDLVDRHVLGAFTAEEKNKVVAPWLGAIESALPLLLKGEAETFANRLHLAMEAAN